MQTQKLIRLASLAIVLVGGAYLSATPAQAAEAHFFCTDAQWMAAIGSAQAACGGSASIVAECIGSSLFVREIYCNP